MDNGFLSGKVQKIILIILAFGSLLFYYEYWPQSEFEKMVERMWIFGLVIVIILATFLLVPILFFILSVIFILTHDKKMRKRALGVKLFIMNMLIFLYTLILLLIFNVD
ncbi:MAG: hypothetical protein C0592_06015 [Marinilabiliales bacterium]|nr:MAG: hypothetical protein C0592_06015 [Marinilabiliales bacterium]